MSATLFLETTFRCGVGPPIHAVIEVDHESLAVVQSPSECRPRFSAVRGCAPMRR